jgi:hypothetical protein
MASIPFGYPAYLYRHLSPPRAYERPLLNAEHEPHAFEYEVLLACCYQKERSFQREIQFPGFLHLTLKQSVHSVVVQTTW